MPLCVNRTFFTAWFLTSATAGGVNPSAAPQLCAAYVCSLLQRNAPTTSTRCKQQQQHGGWACDTCTHTHTHTHTHIMCLKSILFKLLYLAFAAGLRLKGTVRLKNETVVVAQSPPCWWKVRWSFLVCCSVFLNNWSEWGLILKHKMQLVRHDFKLWKPRGPKKICKVVSGCANAFSLLAKVKNQL